MKSTPRLRATLLLGLMLIPLMPAGAAEAIGKENGVLALLGMAAEIPADESPAGVAQEPARVNVQCLEHQIQVQKKRIAELGRTIATLNEQLIHRAPAVSPDEQATLIRERDESRRQTGELRERIGGLEQALAVEKAAAEGAERKAKAAASSLSEALVQNATLKKQVATLDAKDQEIAQLRGSLESLQMAQSGHQQAAAEQQAQLVEKLEEKDDALQTLTARLDTAQTALDEARRTQVRPRPEGQPAIRDYAIGTSLGDDMLSLLKEREAEGIRVDREMALAGIRDTLNGQLQVPVEVLKSTLQKEDKALAARQNKLAADTRKAGESYMKDFSVRKGVKKHPDGFLYLVDYAGDAPFTDTDFITVSVKESLTTGKVLNDMDTHGAYVSQPLNAYPGVFQKAIRLLKNHGSITLVVPPELAYGDKGYPPDIPPGATMIYNLRIQGVDSL
ncbi:TPA: FKBP-type peptidyl-prolyl cis-trans isomerase [Enterobacter cloacae]|nr:FKBP-type peptidyl-prolyl cis-trans isomerase [Enterobacter cloacae]